MKKLTILHGAAIGLLLSSLPVSADIVHLDNVIITFSLCVGNDCVNGESFGFDTLRLKENNLRIHFQDTSNSASFPTNDWRIVANDSSNGGDNYLAIEDSNAGRQVFRVDAGAPANALRVDSGGDVGIGTSNPIVNLHVVDGNTPTLRLEQNGSSGFTPQTWDLAGNEANFFIRDATNGSSLPFRVQPGSGNNNALYIASDGDIGIGTTSPTSELHIRDTADGATVFVESNGPAKLSLGNTATGKEWRLNSAATNDFRITDEDNTVIELSLTASGDLTISGELTTTGTACNGGCDIVFQPDTEIESIEEHAKKMWENSFLPAVGPTKENAPFNITEKTGGILNELEKAHIYIEQLNLNLKDKDRKIQELLNRLVSIEKHLQVTSN